MRSSETLRQTPSYSRVEGDLSGLPRVLEARQEDGGWRLSLEGGADPQEVLKALTARPGVRVEHFELAEPSLDDIFITVVTGGTSPVTPE